MYTTFPPLVDRQRFPVMYTVYLNESLLITLMACDSFLAFAPENVAKADFIGRADGLDWHEYGDSRWPAACCWVEFPVTNQPRFQAAAALVSRREIPSSSTNGPEWAAYNHPLSQVVPRFSTDSSVKRLVSLFRSLEQSHEAIPGPDDNRPRFIQSYLLIGKALGESDSHEIAVYTDLLNQNGVPIPRFRTADLVDQDLRWCRNAINALFHLNRARLDGHAFVSHCQLSEFTPASLQGNEAPARWTAFHPCRTLRLRQSLRELPNPHLHDGIMDMASFEAAMDARHNEVSRELLAFEREARPRDMVMQNTDSNSSIAAYLHRANGAAIYILPEKLVEEFDKTDCSEVRMADLKFPFVSLFLKFVPPQQIMLSEGAMVDGCYLVKQGDEILLTLTSRRASVDYERSYSLTCLDSIFALHLPNSDPDLSVNSAVQLGIEQFFADNAPPSEDLSTMVERPNGLTTEIVDIRATSRKRRIKQFKSQEPAFHACLNIIINAACFISIRPDDIEDSWDGRPSDDLIAAATSKGETRATYNHRSAALRRIDNGDFTRVKICGRKLFDLTSEADFETGRSVRAHWRRGHWRRQRLGTNLTQIMLRWIRPTLVKKDAGFPVEALLYEF